MKKLIFASVLFLSQYALAQAADLRLGISGVASVNVSQAASYQIQISNPGNTFVRNGIVSLPLGGLVVQSLSVVDSYNMTNCSVQAQNLVCSLARVYVNKQILINFSLQAPAIAGLITLQASASHSRPDLNLNNQSASVQTVVNAPVVIVAPPVGPIPGPTPTVYPIAIAAGDRFNFQMCGNSNTPMNFSQCNASNIGAGDLTFLASGATDAGDPSILITYSQANASQLRLIEFDTANNNAVMAEYVGTAISATCFEGTITYQAPYTGHGAFRACK